MKIKWATKLNPNKLIKIYNEYMSGLVEEYEVDDVGISLLLRCEDILLISKGLCRCPCCQSIITRDTNNESFRCPNGCPFEITLEAYLQSWRHTDLWCGNALSYFIKYVEDFPKCRTLGEKMIAIDTLIHSFHMDMKLNRPNRSAGNNLIAGSLKQVVELLDNLSGVQPENDILFKNTVEDMWKRRIGLK